MYDELYPDALDANTADQLAQPASLAPADQGISLWHEIANFKSSAGLAIGKSLIETGRAIDLAGGAWPAVLDKMRGDTKYTDEYFSAHQAIFDPLIDSWTPKPQDVSKAGQLAGQVLGGALQLAASPALMVGTAQLSTAEDLSRQGVDATTANVVGAIAGVSNAVGIKLPMLGKTLAGKVAFGAGGNVAQGVATRAAQGAVLEHGGYDQQALQFDPWDAQALVLDTAMGAVFGAVDYHQQRRASQAEADALLTLNQARHAERDTAPGMPVDGTDLAKHTDALYTAVDQMLRGEAVNVDQPIEGMRITDDPALNQQRQQVGNEIAQAGKAEYGTADPIDAPRPVIDTAPPPEPAPGDTAAAPKVQPTPAEQAALPPSDPLQQEAQRALAENPDLTIPTGNANKDGSVEMVRASDAIAAVDAEAADVQTRASGLFQAVAHCLMGIL